MAGTWVVYIATTHKYGIVREMSEEVLASSNYVPGHWLTLEIIPR